MHGSWSIGGKRTVVDAKWWTVADVHSQFSMAFDSLSGVPHREVATGRYSLVLGSHLSQESRLKSSLVFINVQTPYITSFLKWQQNFLELLTSVIVIKHKHELDYQSSIQSGSEAFGPPHRNTKFEVNPMFVD